MQPGGSAPGCFQGEISITTYHCLCVDLGATSGRGIVCSFDGRRAELTHEYRFPNVLRNVGGALSWDYPALLENVIRSLVDSAPFGIRSVGIDTWGLDFGLLDEKASLLEWPVSYRDLRTEGVMEAVTEHFGRETIYRRTGIQFLSGNTVYQLAALAAKRPELLDKAQTLLMMPDLLFTI